jgi:two-component system phosphate regulon sensor histidine kinase PhoR
VAWSAPGTDRGTQWLRWIWVPIVLPALILAWLAWRAVAGERELYRTELTSAHQRLAAQLAGRADARLEESLEAIAAHMQEWGAVPESTWSDTSGELLLGLRVENGQEHLLSGPAHCPDISSPPRYVRSEDSLEESQNQLLSLLHTPCAAWKADTSDLLAKRQALEDNLVQAPHWRPLLDELFQKTRYQAREAKIWQRDSNQLRALLAEGGRGMSIVRRNARLVVVLHEPLVPRGSAVVCLLDEDRMAQRVLSGLWAAELGKAPSGSWGWRRPGIPWQTLSGKAGEGTPMASVRLSRGSGDWLIGVWPETGELREAARGRTVLLALVLTISLGILLFTSWATANAVDAQRELLAMKTDFVSNVTHELKTPLTSILMFAELLESGKAAARSQEFGAVIRREGLRLSSLIEGILAVARQEAGLGRLEIATLDAFAVAEELCRSLEPQAARKGIRLALSGTSPLKLESDASLIRSILQNLIDNAIKYGSANGRVEVEALQDGDSVRISVLDNGPGIPVQDQKKVFDRFFRGGSGLTRSISGTGLGLSIVRSAAQSLGGKVRLESSSEWGTRVTVTIPAGSPKNG